MNITIGLRIDEFEVISLLGSGAAGTVFMAEARDSVGGVTRRGTRYALKIYNEWVLSIPKQRERISRELLASVRAPHRNLVRVITARIDYGSPARTYSVLELVPGRTLDTFVRENSPVQPDIVESIVFQLADGIRTLHKAQLIHRDIKPQNIMIDEHHHVTLMDLGVVKSEAETTITQSNQFLGTIRYAAPEMLFGEQYDETVDIYSAGAVLYFLLMGKEPFAKEQMFSNLVVEKRKSGCLGLSHDLSQHPSLRVRILSQLVSDMTASGRRWDGSRIKSIEKVLEILEHMEMSDWWISNSIRVVGDSSANHTKLFKTLVLRYLDPRMPKSSSERVSRLRHLVPDGLMIPFLEYLIIIELPEATEELKVILAALREADEYEPGESSD